MTQSPICLSTLPPCCSTMRSTVAKNWSRRALVSSVPSSAVSLVKPAKSANSTATCRRSAGAGDVGLSASAVPQPPQNAMPGSLAKPQLEQTAASGSPQPPQNRRFAALSEPHRGHIMAALEIRSERLAVRFINSALPPDTRHLLVLGGPDDDPGGGAPGPPAPASHRSGPDQQVRHVDDPPVADRLVDPVRRRVRLVGEQAHPGAALARAGGRPR